MKVVIRRDSVSSSTWWKPHFKSNLLNAVDPFTSCRTSSIVGIGCLSLSIASLALLISTQTRLSPSGFGTTISGETHSVGPLGTSSMMSSFINSSSFLSTLSLKPKGYPLTGCAIGLTSLFTCNLN